ncbi:MAG: hypothetical protein MK193_06395 [Lentisphaeria bacterium]|nr:hypothetical protein [Lentisphaeria bacterium]
MKYLEKLIQNFIQTLFGFLFFLALTIGLGDSLIQSIMFYFIQPSNQMKQVQVTDNLDSLMMGTELNEQAH